jgi:hypothetical protein
MYSWDIDRPQEYPLNWLVQIYIILWNPQSSHST